MNLYAIPRHADGATRINVGTLVAGSGRNVIADDRSLGLQPATSAYAHHLQLTELGLLRAAIEVDIGKGVELVDHNVDVVASDTRREHGDALALVYSGDGMKLTAGDVALDKVEVCSYRGHAAWVAYENHLGGQLLGTYMKMEYGAVFIDDEFGGGVIGTHKLAMKS